MAAVKFCRAFLFASVYRDRGVVCVSKCMASNKSEKWRMRSRKREKQEMQT